MKLYGLIGFPLSHSFSEKYFNNKFEHENIPETEYKLFPLANIHDLPSLIEAHPELSGLNVTIPYKEQVINFLDEIDREAKLVGAVNTIKIHKKNNTIRLTGYNTDVIGFENCILPHLKPHIKRALILGTGGGAKAVIFVLRKLGISFQEVTRRPLKANQISYWMINPDLIKSHPLIINTTPLGMYPNIDGYADIPYHHIGNEHIMVDLIYNPPQTRFLKFGEERGAKTINGLKMLQEQAEGAWAIWND